ncbi:aldehyde dehydrogenase 22A1-like [Vigna unguiculata]|uniref:aldehyde dehydrogenase 22A1-like n=1 Tax=Vigna unguiculata TaxID=3917 RepID=UPI001016C86F|nr:aldehyde dehydrogenase 22A1-like [Vigna unguiculata]
MAFWWLLLVLALAFVICKFLLILIPPKVPSIHVDSSDVLDDGNQTQENGFIYVPPRGTAQQSNGKVQCYEPATMKYLGYVPALMPDEVREQVEKVREAQKMWAKTSFKQRRQFLRILLKYIIKHQELICEISSRDTGKTMVDASFGEIMTTCEKINWLLSEGEQCLKPEYRSSGRAMFHKRARVELHPLGVIGAIVSWNYPFHNIFNPMLAAVFSGNGIVIKVSEHASWSGCFYFRIIQSALAAIGAPEDLVEVITGFAETGEALVSSVDKVIFVGSPGIGKMIMSNAAEKLIPVTLELGGKDAFIVCEDVDVDHVAQIAVRAVLQASGQNCAGAERFYVHRNVYASFVSKVTKIIKSVTADPPLAGKYDMGALCMHAHSEKLQSLINDALEKGAEIIARGSFGHIGEGAVDQYFPPTVIVNVNHSMRLMQEEAFGPIMPIMKFSSDEEVVRLANDSKFGLGCAVFSGSQSRARDIASQIHCGIAAINDFGATYMCQSLPFGGVKQSGFGRFGGAEGLRACCLVKAVVEDRWWPFIKTVIPKPLQYPVAENGFEFQESLVEALFGLSLWDRLQALVNVLKMLTEQSSLRGSRKKKDD